MTSHILSAAVLAVLAACGGKARNAETYRAETRQLLDMRSANLKTCYAQALAADPALAGTVTVQFVVAKKTGEITKITVDSASPAPLGKCVVDALAGLKLEPGDRNEGRATFEYAFQPPPAS